DNAVLNRITANINEALEKASGIVIDTRGSGKLTDVEQYYFSTFLRQILPAMLDSNVVLGSTRYRMHNGYATQTGSGADSYYSAFITAAPERLAGRRKTKTPPMAFIINQNSPSSPEILSGLHAAKRTFIVQEGEQGPETGGQAFTMDLSEGVKV